MSSPRLRGTSGRRRAIKVDDLRVIFVALVFGPCGVIRSSTALLRPNSYVEPASLRRLRAHADDSAWCDRLGSYVAWWLGSLAWEAPGDASSEVHCRAGGPCQMRVSGLRDKAIVSGDFPRGTRASQGEQRQGSPGSSWEADAFSVLVSQSENVRTSRVAPRHRPASRRPLASSKAKKRTLHEPPAVCSRSYPRTRLHPRRCARFCRGWCAVVPS